MAKKQKNRLAANEIVKRRYRMKGHLRKKE